MPFMQGRNPYQFTLGAIALAGAVVVIVTIAIDSFVPRDFAYDGSSAAYGTYRLTYTLVALLGCLSLFSFVGWLVSGALMWGPRRDAQAVAATDSTPDEGADPEDPTSPEGPPAPV